MAREPMVTDEHTFTDSWLNAWHYNLSPAAHAAIEHGEPDAPAVQAWRELEEISWERVKGGRVVFYQR